MPVRELTSIAIKGRCFPSDCMLELFPGAKHRVAFVFGRNGSGKSTLSESLRMMVSNQLPSGVECLSLLDGDGRVLPDERDVLSKAIVFDEAFVEKQVKVSSDGLNAIVMLGDAGNLATRIEQANDDKDEEVRALEVRREKLAQFNDAGNPLSPEYHRGLLTEALKRPGGWCDRQRDIKALSRSASVTSNLLEQLSEMPIPEKSEASLRQEIEDGTKRLSSLKAGDLLPDVPVLPAFVTSIRESDLIGTLAQAIDKPVLSDREKRLMEVAEQLGTSRLREASSYFSQEFVSYCPYCFRDIGDDESQSLIDAVSLVLNEEADKHARELNASTLRSFSIDLAEFECLEDAPIDECAKLVSSANAIIAEYNDYLRRKSDNLYAPIEIGPLGLSGVISEISQSLSQISIARDAWNQAINSKNRIEAGLVDANKQLARIEVDSHLLQIGAQSEALKALSKEILQSERKISDLERKIRELEAQKSSIKVALDSINKSLAFIFLDPTRLVLEGEGGEYVITSHGARVAPKDVSHGERNAIALCYFFTLIGEGKSIDAVFSDEMLLVIDDPVSSFDHENRIGILSYLRSVFSAVLDGNPDNKIICLTHDGYAMNAFDKMCRELVNRTSRKDPSLKMKWPGLFHLANGHLSKWSETSLRYRDMLTTMYDYSLEPSDDLRPHIGNVARRALEAFATFEYGMGLSEFADSPAVLSRIDSESIRQYFSALLFHLVLHAESHTEDAVAIEGAVETLPEYTSGTVDRIIRDSLCLLYCLNKEHVLTHLAERNGVESVIENWVDGLRSHDG